ncbi:MAG: indole-3-glycerol phosphate synthase TrpC [Alphaproteobacteria bacterium]
MSHSDAVAGGELGGVLSEICASRRKGLVAAKGEVSLTELESAAREAGAVRSFLSALEAAAARSGHGLICESKRRSPSGGELRADLRAGDVARAFVEGGAACLSVLTEAVFFGGSWFDLQEARAAVGVPVLRKDFILDSWQVAETRALGADCLLLILAALDDVQAREFEDQAFGYGLEVLLEVTSEEELERALRMRSRLLGVNNRDLQTLETDTARGDALIARAVAESGAKSGEHFVIGESGIHSVSGLRGQRERGARGFLVGEHLMRSGDIVAATRALAEA